MLSLYPGLVIRPGWLVEIRAVEKLWSPRNILTSTPASVWSSTWSHSSAGPRLLIANAFFEFHIVYYLLTLSDMSIRNVCTWCKIIQPVWCYIENISTVFTIEMFRIEQFCERDTKCFWQKNPVCTWERKYFKRERNRQFFGPVEITCVQNMDLDPSNLDFRSF